MGLPPPWRGDAPIPSRAHAFRPRPVARSSKGGDASQALHNSLDLARAAERLGYSRYWLAEHHNMPGIASAATAVVIGHVAAGTSTIRVGAGGIMLPNHAPLMIAEAVRHPGAPSSPAASTWASAARSGTDQVTARALRRTLAGDSRRLPAGRDRADELFPPGRAGQRSAGRAGRGPGRAAVDPGLQPLRRPARRPPGPALRLRLALRPGRARATRWRSTASSSSRPSTSTSPMSCWG